MFLPFATLSFRVGVEEVGGWSGGRLLLTLIWSNVTVTHTHGERESV